MTEAGPLRWCTGAGWLVLAGGGKWQNGETGTIDAATLGWANLDQPIAVLLAAGGSTAEGEALLEHYAEMGGPGGYVVPIFDVASARQPENCKLLEQAGMVYIANGPDVLNLTQALRETPALEALEQAFRYGAVILGMEAGALAFGAWVATHDHPDRTEPGWGWLPQAVIEPCFARNGSAGHLHSLVNAHPDCLGLGIPERVALALGPNGRVETVGEGQITVVLSKNAEEG